MSAGQAARSYILLAVGDALVAQIPALLISVAAAMVVSRVGKDRTSARRSAARCSTRRRRWRMTAAIVGCWADAGHAAPGVPAHRRRRPGGAGLVAGAAGRARLAAEPSMPRRRARPDAPRPAGTTCAGGHAGPGGRLPADRAGRQGAPGRPAGRIKGVRKKFAQEVGFLPPAVHIRDNLELKPSVYRVTLRGAVVGEGEAFPGMLLAINPGGAPSSCPARAPPTRPSACRRCGSTSASGDGPNGRIYGG
jgi:flagellar biosynthesis protein FlhA